jgi:NADH-quinone oxidoreductase subunit J
MTLDLVIFFVSAVIAVFGAVMMIAQRNPVASVLYLILSFVAQAVLYVQLGALFVGAMLIIVYAGAILVLFLFVIMLLNLRSTDDLGQHSSILSRTAKLTLGGLLLVELVFITREVFVGLAQGTMAPGSTLGDFGSVRSVSMLLFTKYLYPFELTGVLMLIAVVGAVVMARKEQDDEIGGSADDSAELSEPRPDEVIKK